MNVSEKCQWSVTSSLRDTRVVRVECISTRLDSLSSFAYYDIEPHRRLLIQNRIRLVHINFKTTHHETQGIRARGHNVRPSVATIRQLISIYTFARINKSPTQLMEHSSYTIPFFEDA